MARTKGRALWRKLLLALASFALFLALLELLARLLLPDFGPVLLRQGAYRNPLPLATGATVSTFEVMPSGETLPIEKGEGEIRVFVLGESSVYGAPLDPRASAPTMLHDLLAEAHPDARVSVVNMGIPGSISANVFYYLVHARRFSPDYVIFYMGMNDEDDMPGEQCMPVRHPRLHRTWRGIVERSRLAWAVRVFGPAMLPSRRGRGGMPDWSGWDCPEDPFPLWTDILVELSTRMGAEVIVTTPVRSALAKLEPGVMPSFRGPPDPSTMLPSYRRLLSCRLTEGCDFASAFAEYVSSQEPVLDSETKRKLMAPMFGDRFWFRLPCKSLIEMHHWEHKAKAKAWKASAERHGATFIDFQAALRAVSPHNMIALTWFVDEIHLSLEGLSYLARFWAEAVKAHTKGTAPAEPALPAAADVTRYWHDSGTNGARELVHYLRKGWYLTTVPGLERAAAACKEKDCSDSDLAKLALGWLRSQVGLDPQLPPELAEKLKHFGRPQGPPRSGPRARR